VENALRHGVAASAGPVRLTITARADDGTLELSVTDTGMGVRGNGAGTGNGVGLANTRARLEELYGDRGSVCLENAEGGGARATVRLPLRHAADATAQRRATGDA
jgi:LytS/YehU family sensor histidine kinase